MMSESPDIIIQLLLGEMVKSYNHISRLIQHLKRICEEFDRTNLRVVSMNIRDSVLPHLQKAQLNLDNYIHFIKGYLTSKEEDP